MATQRKGRLVAWGIVGLVVAGALAWAFWPQSVLVDLGEVSRGTLQVTVDDDARTRVKEVYVVSSPVSGRMRRVEVKVGDNVRAGETVLATIQPSDPGFLDARSRRQAEAEVKASAAALDLAKAERSKAKAELDLARSELQRSQELARRGTISVAALDRAMTAVETGKAALATAIASQEVRSSELEMAKARLIEPEDVAQQGGDCCIRLRAPVDGSVLQVLRESEQVVEPGMSLIDIGDPRSLEIVAELLSSDAVRIAEGAPVTIEGWGGPALAGRVRRIEPFGFAKISALGIEEQRVNVIIDFAGPEAERARLGHGFRVEVRIVVWQADNILRIPVAALFRDGADWAVFADEAGRARLRHVEIDHSNGQWAALGGGLEEGEKVILHPSDQIRDGVRIEQR